MVIILAAVALNWPLPFIAVQILWINLVTSGLQDVALAFEPGEKGIIRRKPRDADEGILSRRLLERLAGVGLLLAAGTSWTFWWAMETTGGDLDAARSVALTQMVVFQNFHVFNCRSLDRSIFSISPFTNKYLYLSVAAALAFHVAVLHLGWLQTLFRTVPLTLEQWLVVIAVGVFVIIGGELDKIVNRWRKHYIG
jgi:Ca2+-transporting ATPase